MTSGTRLPLSLLSDSLARKVDANHNQWLNPFAKGESTRTGSICRIARIRGPKHHINIRILQTMFSGIYVCLGPLSQDVGSSCLRVLCSV